MPCMEWSGVEWHWGATVCRGEGCGLWGCHAVSGNVAQTVKKKKKNKQKSGKPNERKKQPSNLFYT